MIANLMRFWLAVCKWLYLLISCFIQRFWYFSPLLLVILLFDHDWRCWQWRSQGLPGWATRPPGGPKWGRKWVKVWEKIRKLNRDLRKNEENGTLAHPGLWGWLRALVVGSVNRFSEVQFRNNSKVDITMIKSKHINAPYNRRSNIIEYKMLKSSVK